MPQQRGYSAGQGSSTASVVGGTMTAADVLLAIAKCTTPVGSYLTLL